MTSQDWAQLVPAIVALIGAVAAWLHSRATRKMITKK